MKYKGIELVEITKPSSFRPTGRKCSYGEKITESCIDYIYAIGPSSMDLPVRAISDDGSIGTNCYKYCAEIPKTRRATHREVSNGWHKVTVKCPKAISITFSFCKSSHTMTQKIR